MTKTISSKVLLGVSLSLIAILAGILTVLTVIDSRISVIDTLATNITDSSITITWVSDTPYIGRVAVTEKTDKLSQLLVGFAGQIAYDTRDIELNTDNSYSQIQTGAQARYTHHVTVRNLKPETDYYFKVLGIFLGKEAPISTLKTKPLQMEVKLPYSAYGKVENINTTDGVIIIGKETVAGGATTDESSELISTTIANNSSYSIDLGYFNQPILQGNDLFALIKSERRINTQYSYESPGVNPLETIIVSPPASNILGSFQAIPLIAAQENSCAAGRVLTVTSNTRLREEPNTTSSQRGIAAAQSSITINCCTAGEGGMWFKLQSGEYVKSSLFGTEPPANQANCNVAAIPILTPMTPPVQTCVEDGGRTIGADFSCTTSTKTYKVKSGGNANIRGCASRAYGVIGVQAIGSTVEACEENVAGQALNGVNNWKRVKLSSGKTGYIFANLLEAQSTGTSPRSGGGTAPGGPGGSVSQETETPRTRQPLAAPIIYNSNTDDTTEIALPSNFADQNIPTPYAEYFATDYGNASFSAGSLKRPGSAAYPKVVQIRDAYFSENLDEILSQNPVEYARRYFALLQRFGYVGMIATKSNQDYGQEFNLEIAERSREKWCVAGKVIVLDVAAPVDWQGRLKELKLYSTDNTVVRRWGVDISRETIRDICGFREGVGVFARLKDPYSPLDPAAPPDGTRANNLDDSPRVAGAQDNPLLINKSGRYEFFVSDSIKATKDIIINDGSVELKLFIDLNENGIKDPEESYFEAIETLKVTRESDVLDYRLNAGWNLLHLPLVNNGSERIDTAAKLLKHWQSQGANVTQAAIFSNGSFKTVAQRESGEFGSDFNLTPGSGIFILNRGSQITVSFAGQKLVENPTLLFSEGWNLIGLPQVVESSRSSEALLSNLASRGVSADSVSQLDNGIYQSVVRDDGVLFGNNFNIVERRGYFVRVIGGGGTSVKL